MSRREIEDAIDAIESRPLSRAERDRLQAPLLALLRLDRLVERVQREGFASKVQL